MEELLNQIKKLADFGVDCAIQLGTENISDIVFKTEELSSEQLKEVSKSLDTISEIEKIKNKQMLKNYHYFQMMYHLCKIAIIDNKK